MLNERKYYVYEYVDPRNGEVFYIGQGKGKRFNAHLLEAKRKKSKLSDLLKSPIKNQKLIKIIDILNDDLEPIINKLDKNLTRQQAFDIEHSYIISLGRKNIGTGSLLNLCDGYEFCDENICVPEYVYRNDKNNFYKTDEGKKAIEKIKSTLKEFYKTEEGERNKEYFSKLYKGKTPEEWLGEERGKKLREIRRVNAKNWWSQYTKEERHEMFLGEKNPFYGKTHTEETRRKISKARKGSKVSEETKKKISKTLKSKKNTKSHGGNHHLAKKMMLFCPDGTIEYINGNLCGIARKHRLANNTIKNLANGKKKEYKGYKAKWGWDK